MLHIWKQYFSVWILIERMKKLCFWLNILNTVMTTNITVKRWLRFVLAFVSRLSDVWNPALPLASLPLYAFMMCKSHSVSQNSFFPSGPVAVFQSGVFFISSPRGSIRHMGKGGRGRERRKRRRTKNILEGLRPLFWQKEKHYSWRQEYGRLFARTETCPCPRWKTRSEFWLQIQLEIIEDGE